MNKELALRIIELLSAIESWALSGERRGFPDYLNDNLASVISEMRDIVLDKTEVKKLA